MNNKEIQKAIIFLTIICLFFTYTGYVFNFYGHSSDNEAHKQMAKDSSINPNYAPLFRNISWLFVNNEFTWTFFIMFLFAFVNPLLFVLATRSWWAGLFFFAITNLFYWNIQGGYAQGLLLMFAVALFAFKNIKIRLILLFFGVASHSTGGLILPIIFILILLNENINLILTHFNNFKTKILLGCSAFWGKNKAPEILGQQINQKTLSGEQVSYWGQFITPGSLLTLFFKIFPLFFGLPAIYKLWEKKRFDLFLLIPIGLIASLEYGTRPWYLLTIPLVIGFTWFFKDLKNPFWIKTSLVMVGFYFLFQIYMWVNFNLVC